MRREIAKLQESLQVLYRRPAPWDFDAIRDIEVKLDRALENEEIYWKQRSRENWLQWGD